jgi:Zn-finger nucleic acid-binding protein
VEIDACLSCGSFWLDQGEMKVLTHRVADRQTHEGPVAPSKYQCPVCSKPMQQYRFLTHNELLVDVCPDDHGLYLERDELVKAVEL